MTSEKRVIYHDVNKTMNRINTRFSVYKFRRIQTKLFLLFYRYYNKINFSIISIEEYEFKHWLHKYKTSKLNVFISPVKFFGKRLQGIPKISDALLITKIKHYEFLSSHKSCSV